MDKSELTEEQIQELKDSCVEVARIGALWWQYGFPDISLALLKVNLDQTHICLKIAGEEPSFDFRGSMSKIMEQLVKEIQERKKNMQ